MTNPIRILHVLGRLDIGGAETMIMNLYRNIDRTKVQFDFVVHTKNKGDYEDEVRALGGRIYSVPSYTVKNHSKYKKVWNDFFHEHKEYKIIHGHVRSTASIYLKIANKYGLLTIAHSHNTSSGKGLSAFVKNTLQYPIRNTADYLFACSEFAGNWLFGESAYKRPNFFLLKNAIDVEQFIYNEEVRNDKRKELNLEGKFVIGNVARFHPQKNHTFLIDVFKKVHDKNKNTALMLVGRGSLQPQIKEKVDSLGLKDNVIFTGVRSDIPDLLQAMDVFFMPSLYEGLPVTLVEAQASGLKCIVSDTITSEVSVTDLVNYTSLDESPDYWAESILSVNNDLGRKDMRGEIVASGYDIKESARWLEYFYLELSN